MHSETPHQSRRGGFPLSTHSNPIQSPQTNRNLQRCRPKAAARRQAPISISKPHSKIGNEPAENQNIAQCRNRPKHGEHKWMRQLETLEKQEDLLDDLLTARTLKPSTSFAITPMPLYHESRHMKSHIGGHLDAHSDQSTTQLSQESYFSPFLPTTRMSQSLPRLIQDEKQQPRASGLLVDHRHPIPSSVPKFPKITSTCLVSPMDGIVMHRKSRSFSDPTIHPLNTDRN